MDESKWYDRLCVRFGYCGIALIMTVLLPVLLPIDAYNIGWAAAREQTVWVYRSCWQGIRTGAPA